MNYTTLISVANLAKHLGSADLVVFDCRHELTNPDFGPKAYAESHIPGARFAHVDRDLAGPLNGMNGRHPLPDPKTFIAWLGRMGVANDLQVVAYDQAGGTYASRLWWMLRWVGHHKVAIVDGGSQAWNAAGHAVTTELPTPTPQEFIGKPDRSWLDSATVAKRISTSELVLIDARSNDRFHGRNETIDPVAGHIPGALNRFYKENLDAQGFFKSPEKLRAEFKTLVGDAAPEKVVHQCGSGVSACHNLLAMEIAGIKGSRLYPGSWSEWIVDPSHPLAR